MKYRRTLFVLLAMAIALVFSPRLAQAAPNDAVSIAKLKNNSTVTVYLDDTKGVTPTGAASGWDTKSVKHAVLLRYYGKLGSITDVEETNWPVVTAFYTDSPSEKKDILFIHANRPGKSTVTYTYKGANRKVNINVKKYTRPVSSLKIGKTNYTTKLKKDARIRGAMGRIGGKKVSVKATSGWKISGIYVRYIDYARDTAYKWKKIKNGALIPKKYNDIEIVMQNKKTGGLLSLYATK